MAKPLSAGDLESVLEAGDVEACVKLLASATESARRPLAKLAIATLKSARKGEFRLEEGGRATWIPNATTEQLRTALFAVLGTAALSELKALGFVAVPDLELEDRVLAFLREIEPSWLADWAEAIAETTPSRWTFARRLVREGICTKPASPEYILGMLNRGFDATWGVGGRLDRPPRESLLEDPDLLEDEVWRLFEVEGSGELSLAARDKYSRDEMTWSASLLELAREGRLDRGRLLDASLEALERDFAPFRAGWFSRFHEALEPTLDERAERCERYVRLLASSIPPTVSFALSALDELAKAGRLPTNGLGERLRPALLARAKVTAKGALALLERAIRGEPRTAGEIVRTAVVALGHEAVDVQKSALEIIERHGSREDASLRQEAQGARDSVAASLRARLDKWLGGDLASTKKAMSNPAKKVAPARRKKVSAFDADRAIEPIENLDELIDRFAFVLENPGDPDEIERVLDGVSRLCGDRPADLDARVAPLVKRARALAKRYAFEKPVVFELARLAVAWAVKELLPRPESEEKNTTLAFFAGRDDALAERLVKEEARPLLSAPTHRGGFIDPKVLAARMKKVAAASRTDDWDMILARLRGGGEKTGAVSFTVKVHDSSHSYNDRDGKKRTVTHHWIVIDRRPAPRASISTLQLPQLLHSRRPPRGRISRYDPGVVAGDESAIRWAMTLWPGWKEPIFAEGVEELASNLDWWETEWHDRAFLEPLVDPTTPMTPMALLLLVLGLAAKEPGQHGLAVDALVAAVEDARLEADSLGDAMATVLPTGLVLAARWAKTLAVAARASKPHAELVARAIERALRGPAERAPKDLAKLLELWHELLVEVDARVTDTEAITFLRALDTGGKTGKLVRTLLERADPGGSS